MLFKIVSTMLVVVISQIAHAKTICPSAWNGVFESFPAGAISVEREQLKDNFSAITLIWPERVEGLKFSEVSVRQKIQGEPSLIIQPEVSEQSGKRTMFFVVSASQVVRYEVDFVYSIGSCETAKIVKYREYINANK